jgi:hypothetical protein
MSKWGFCTTRPHGPGIAGRADGGSNLSCQPPCHGPCNPGFPKTIHEILIEIQFIKFSLLSGPEGPEPALGTTLGRLSK